MALIVLAGRGDLNPLADETAGESFVRERLEPLHPTRAPNEIAVLCRGQRRKAPFVQEQRRRLPPPTKEI